MYTDLHPAETVELIESSGLAVCSTARHPSVHLTKCICFSTIFVTKKTIFESSLSEKIGLRILQSFETILSKVTAAIAF